MQIAYVNIASYYNIPINIAYIETLFYILNVF